MQADADPVARNRSAPTSLVVGSLAALLVLVGLIPGGQLFQLLWLVALVLAGLGIALGFVGLTVSRAGAGRRVLSTVALVANVLLLGWLLVLAAQRF
ncbi:MAG TPA: hypothetical protein VFH74_15185 [Gaiellales bacterium]|nr:hypothetical protein [Gaiellales bacterium]